jgi:hypothetical protein
MAETYALQSGSQGWQFINEAVLEDFIWDHLEPLLGKSLRQQHHSAYALLLAKVIFARNFVNSIKNTSLFCKTMMFKKEKTTVLL